MKGVPEKELSLIRQALQRGQLTGSERFIDETEKILGRRVEFRAQGRPSRGCGRSKINLSPFFPYYFVVRYYKPDVDKLPPKPCK